MLKSLITPKSIRVVAFVATFTVGGLERTGIMDTKTGTMAIAGLVGFLGGLHIRKPGDPKPEHTITIPQQNGEGTGA
jgi:hypothetical protein